jgi:hypothetical protein
MGMRKYVKDYKTILSVNENGKQIRTYEYQGDYFKLPFSNAQMQKFKIIFLLVLFGVLAAHIAGGFMNNAGMRQFYVAIPFVLTFLPIFNLLRSGVRLPVEERKYRREEIGVTYERFSNHSLILLITLGVCLAGEVIFLLFFSKGSPALSEYYFLAVELTALALSLLIFFNIKKIVITRVPEEEKTSVSAMGA